jgi:hypothetical protein
MLKAPVFPPGYATKFLLSLLYKTLFSVIYALFPEPTLIVVRLLQPEKAPFPMLVTLSGIDKFLRLLQEKKAQYPILVTLLGMVIFDRLAQELKA